MLHADVRMLLRLDAVHWAWISQHPLTDHRFCTEEHGVGLSSVDHFVVLMMENRSFDHLSSLSRASTVPAA
jgi:phospholipase C